ncbi:MAG TPA: 4-hydroxy-tetrahydrodipicolinate synthase [Acidimicrobiales bacterium]|nr:4-hydroxy-tetrahydrodipicolinate synthase [Acidimicrobiales bacterium]
MNERGPGRYGAVVTAMVTPFDDSGKLDLDGAQKLAAHLAAHGSEAVVLAGTTGESPVLSDSERLDLWHAVVESSPIPVIAGSTTNDTAHSVELTRGAEAAGVAGILAVTPYYNRPSQLGIARHFTAVAEATSLPVILYDIPVRAGRKIATETMVRLAREVPNIVGVKDAAGDVSGTARLLWEAPAGFECYSGEDSLTLPLLSVGAVGAISVASHWVGPEIAEMIKRFCAGDVDGARWLNAEMLDAVAFQASDETPNPLPAKAMLRAQGLPAGECRLPHGSAPAGLDERATALLSALGQWRAERLGRADRADRAAGSAFSAPAAQEAHA